MEELILTIVKDLPSTAVLILFVWFTSKQFNRAIDLIAQHLKDINRLLEQCLRVKETSELEKDLDRRMAKITALMEHFKNGRINFDPPED